MNCKLRSDDMRYLYKITRREAVKKITYERIEKENFYDEDEKQKRYAEYKYFNWGYMDAFSKEMLRSFFGDAYKDYKKNRELFFGYLDMNILESLYNGICVFNNKKYFSIADDISMFDSEVKERYILLGAKTGAILKDQFKKKNHMLPNTYYNKLLDNKIKRVDYKDVSINLDVNKDIIDNFDKKVDTLNNSFKSLLEKREKLDSLKKSITGFMISAFGNKKGYGELLGLINDTFYGMSNSSLIDNMKKEGIKVPNNSLNNVFNDNHVNYKIAMLSLIDSYINDPSSLLSDERDVRLFTIKLASYARYKFDDLFKESPYDNLINSKRTSNFTQDIYQMTLDDFTRKRK